MKKGQLMEGVVVRVEFPNKGIVLTDDGTKTVVKNVVPGQKVKIAVQKVRKGKCEGRIVEVLEKSPLETDSPACIHFGSCGGCIYQNLPYDEQLKLKASQVKELLDGVIASKDKSYEFLGIAPSPRQSGYRNKMEFTFGDECKDGPLALGMHKSGSFYDIVSVTDCKIVDDDFKTILTATLRFFREKNISFYHRLRHTGYLRHLLVRKAAKTGEILTDLITTTEISDERLLLEWKEMLLSQNYTGTLTGILHTRNDSPADAVINQGTDLLYGRDYFYEELLGLKFRITPFSFFQTNSSGAEVLYETAKEFIGDFLTNPQKSGGNVVFDLYSGTGTIAQLLAPAAKKVIGVEIVEEAVAAARENAAQNGLTNCEFIAGDVLKVIAETEQKPDYIILDPPRDGIHPKALDKIIRFEAPQILYISCKPTSLARDLVTLQARGYEVKKVRCVDMFPGTVHVETVVLLSHKKPDSVINVKVEFGEGKGKVPLDNIAKRAGHLQDD